ncbi:MAG: acyltransferase family protein [Promethearchaeota archaeon]
MDEKLEISDNDLKSDIDLKSGKNYFQVDIMKVWMISLVILDHSTLRFLGQYGGAFWERIAIPGFLVVMGFNLGISFKEKGITTLKEAYSKEYFVSKMKRYVIPYIILYLIQGIIYIIVHTYFRYEMVYLSRDLEGLRLLGFTFFWGPGMWFIPALFGSILIFPLLYICFNKAPIITFIACFVIEWSMHLLRFNIVPYESHITIWFFITHIFYMFSGIGMGLWISKNHEIFSLRNIIFWILLPLSLIFLGIYTVNGYEYLMLKMAFYGLGWIGGDYNFITFPWSAILFLIILKIFPKNPKNPENIFSKIIKEISRSTYHILLVQILYFSILFHFGVHRRNELNWDLNPTNLLWYYPLNLLITFTGGVIWQTLESKFYKQINENKIYGIIYKILFSLAVVFYVVFLFSRYIIFINYPVS